MKIGAVATAIHSGHSKHKPLAKSRGDQRPTAEIQQFFTILNRKNDIAEKLLGTIVRSLAKSHSDYF
jgi:hypothetical protein